jgi:hypothetical protein
VRFDPQIVATTISFLIFHFFFSSIPPTRNVALQNGKKFNLKLDKKDRLSTMAAAYASPSHDA